MGNEKPLIRRSRGYRILMFWLVAMLYIGGQAIWDETSAGRLLRGLKDGSLLWLAGLFAVMAIVIEHIVGYRFETDD